MLELAFCKCSTPIKSAMLAMIAGLVSISFLIVVRPLLSLTPSPPSASPQALAKVSGEGFHQSTSSSASKNQESDILRDADRVLAQSAATHQEGDLLQDEEHVPAHLGKEAFAHDIEDFLRSAIRTPTRNRTDCGHMRPAYGSQCPAWAWLSKYHGPEKDGRSPVFVDIGCNKGYSTASWYEHFAPTSGVTKKALYALHSKMGTSKACGVCQDCHEYVRLGKNSARFQPLVYCIDGSPSTHKRTKDIADILKKNNQQVAGWQLFWQAMTNKTGHVYFEVCSHENCGIGRGSSNGDLIKVPAFTYDDFADAQQITFADLVKIDTEGEEPLVIQGMHRSLKAQKIGFLAFEISGSQNKGLYHYFDFRRIVDLLDAYGYDCYIDSAKGGMPSLTGCHDRRFGQPYSLERVDVMYYRKIGGVIPQWGNAVCGLRAKAEIRGILNYLSQPNMPGIKMG